MPVCTETRFSYSYHAVKGLVRIRVAPLESLKEVLRSQDVSTDREKILMSTVTQHTVSIIEACGGERPQKTTLKFDDFCRMARRSNKGKRRENRSLDDVRELDDARQSKILQGRTLEEARQGRLLSFPQFEHRADSEAALRDDA